MSVGFTSVSTSLSAASLAGQLADSGDHDMASYTNSEASAEIPFGVMLAQGTGDNDCLKMAAQADKLIGVSIFSHAYNKDNQLGSTGVKPDVVVNVLKRGRCWVTVADAVTPGDPVRVNEVGGTFQTGASETVTVLLKHARFLTTAGIGELAMVEIDMLTRSDNTSDT